MPADISIVNGRKEFATALKPAWHDAACDYVLDEVPDSATMIKAAHLDWEVQPQPIYNAEGRIIEGYSTTVRMDTGAHLGIVSDQYRVRLQAASSG